MSTQYGRISVHHISGDNWEIEQDELKLELNKHGVMNYIVSRPMNEYPGVLLNRLRRLSSISGGVITDTIEEYLDELEKGE